MARLVRVATVTSEALKVNGRRPPTEVLEVMEERWRAQIEAVAPDDVDLIVLPEHGDRPHQGHYPPELLDEYYELRGDRFNRMYADYARELGCNIAYSGLRVDGDQKFNSTMLYDRSGNYVDAYDKTFLTPGERFKRRLDAGSGAKVIELDIGRIAPVICFDLNFTELLDDVTNLRPELILFSSVFHGGYLQGHWAYTAGAYFIGSVYPPNRSTVLDPLGRIVASSTNYTNYAVTTINLDYELVHLDFNKPALAKLKKEYGPHVTITDPGQIGVLMVSSLDEEVSAAEMVREFDVELLSDYFTRVREYTGAASPSPAAP